MKPWLINFPIIQIIKYPKGKESILKHLNNKIPGTWIKYTKTNTIT